MTSDERIWIGVLRCALSIPGARTLKDRRQAVRSLVDRMRHRHGVTVHEIDRGERPTMAVIVATTGGNDGRLIHEILDRCADMARSAGSVVATGIDVDVFRWHPHGIEALDLEDGDG